MRNINESMEETIIVKPESINLTHLPSTYVVSNVIIFCTFAASSEIMWLKKEPVNF